MVSIGCGVSWLAGLVTAACPHPYTIRFRNGLGKQVEEGGFDTQDDAIERLT